jgi:hypothetical protein
MLKIVLYAHLVQPNFPWSTGKVKRIRTMEATDATMKYADAFVAESQARRDTSRLRVHWELKGGS